MSTESNKVIVRRYFEEALDKRNPDVLDEFVAIDCVIHRAEAAEPIRGLKGSTRWNGFSKCIASSQQRFTT